MVAFGRGLFGCTLAWFALLVMLFLPIWGAGLAATTVLLIRDRRPDAVGRLGASQAFLHVGLWVAVFVAGLTIADAGDFQRPQDMVLTKLLGGGAEDPRGDVLLPPSLFAIALLWLAILIVALVQRITRRSIVADLPVPPRWSAPR